MATTNKPAAVEYNTVLVLLPPREYAHRIDPFRRVHDKAGVRWPAHITLLNFVEKELVAGTLATLREVLKDFQPFKLRLHKVDSFPMAGYDTVHLTTALPEDEEDVQGLWKTLATTMEYSGRSFTPHVTLGQAPNRNSLVALQLLYAKAQHLLSSVKDLEWTVGSVVVLQRDEADGGAMKFYDEVFLGNHTESAYQIAPSLPTVVLTPNGSWTWNTTATQQGTTPPSTLSVATYNLLQDPAFPFANRADRIINEIADANADILCLQEVSDENLASVMGSPRIKSIYTFSSRDPVVTLENERNLMVLSRLPFTYSAIDTGSKHKPAYIAMFDSMTTGSTPFIVACVHLTAGRAASPLEQKSRELSKIVDHLTSNHPSADWVIVGDFNWPNEIHSTPADELFEDTGAPSGDPTYEPLRNPLAAQTAKESKTGQRYDRVFLKRNGTWVAREIGTFGISTEPASDHWGLKVSMQRVEDLVHLATIPAQKLPSNVSGAPPTPSILASDLHALLQSEGWLPSPARETSMERALNLLRAVLCPALQAASLDPESAQGKQAPRVVIKIEAVGSYALGVHSSSSDIDCLAIGNISPKTFWMLARCKIRTHVLKARTDGLTEVVQLKRFVKDALVQMMELDVCGIKVDLQYCAAAGLSEHWNELAEMQPDSPYFSLPHSSLVTLNAYRDLLTLKKVIPSLAEFRLAHRSLKLFLTQRGLWGARFGYLGGFHLTLLLTRIALSLPAMSKAPHLIENFFKTYAEWDWGKDIVYPIPSRAPETGSTLNYKRVLSREPMVVLSIQRPLSNLTFHASWNSVQTLSREFKRAHRSISDCQPWSTVCGMPSQDTVTTSSPLKEFMDIHRHFIKLDVHFWGGNDMQGRALIGWLESRIVSLLVQLQQNVPELVIRFWPDRLVDQTTVDSESRDPNAFYLLGVSASTSPDTAARSDGDVPRRNSDIQAALSSSLRGFEQALRNNERFYVETHTFISVGLLKHSQLPSSVILDPFEWQDNGFDATQEEEDEEDEIEDKSEPSVMEGGITTPDESWDDFKARSSSQRKRMAAAAKSKSTPHIAAAKLRTSTDVYNRLIWDSTGGISKEGYAIGYEDRFKGIKETPLTAWKREVEDESFIPFHRVVYFKRLVDSVYVWDRRSKVDLVFGSGVNAA